MFRNSERSELSKARSTMTMTPSLVLVLSGKGLGDRHCHCHGDIATMSCTQCHHAPCASCTGGEWGALGQTCGYFPRGPTEPAHVGSPARTLTQSTRSYHVAQSWRSGTACGASGETVQSNRPRTNPRRAPQAVLLRHNIMACNVARQCHAQVSFMFAPLIM